MKTRVSVLLLMAVLCGAAGCMHNRGSEKYDEYRAKLDKMTYGQYMGMATGDLFNDFGDMFRFHIAAGPGIGVHVQPTELLQAGCMFADSGRLGWGHRSFGYWSERRKEGGVGPVYYRDYVMEPIYGTPGLFRKQRGWRNFTLRDNEYENWSDCGVSAYAVFMGAGGYWSPKETLDFALNLFVNYPVAIVRPALKGIGIQPPEMDYSNDDTPSRIRKREGMVWIPEEPTFYPAEAINDWIELPY